VHSHGPCEQKPTNNFGQKGAWAYPGAARNFAVVCIVQSRNTPKVSSDVSIHRFFLISATPIIPVAPKFTAASRGTPCDSVASCYSISYVFVVANVYKHA